MRANSLAVPTARAVPTTYLWFGAVLLLAVIALLPAIPPLYHTPDTDSSIFLFIGEKIRQGDLPFRDWYDHKPPLIFYLNALGLWLGQGSRWGVWAIELVSLSAASLLCFAFLRRFYGALTAFLATGAFLLNLAFVHQRGNLTEEYALPFQFAAIFLTLDLDRLPKPGWRFFAIGAALAMASSLKQPMAGTGVAVSAALLIQFAAQRRLPALLRGVGLMALGFGLVWACWFAYFALAGIFPEFWEAAFAYNFALSGIPLEKRIRALVSGMDLLYSHSGFFLAGMLAWLAAIPYLLTRDDRIPRALTDRALGWLLSAGGLVLLALGLLRQPLFALPGLVALLLGGFILFGLAERLLRARLSAGPRQADLFLPVLIALVDLPVAVTFSSLSGNNFGHYFMALLPSLALLTAFWLHSLTDLLAARAGQPLTASQPLTAAWLAALLLPIFVPGILETADRIGPRGDRQVEAVVQYVKDNTRPEDFVLQWGIVPQVNLLSGRDAPSRYFFPDPLFVDGYSGTVQTGELLRDLQANPPVLIVDEGIARLPLLLPAEGQPCETVYDPQVYEDFKAYWKDRVEYDLPQMPEGMDAVYYWICQNYTSAGLVGELGWPVYRWKGN